MKIKEIEKPATFGERLSDKIADFGGSWKFIIIFIASIIAWIGMNVWVYANQGFDPYPFIFLNLVLSCVAALQAPVIMMSQNRQEDHDREQAKWDYEINMKAEKEIKDLHKKFDLLMAQHTELMNMMKK
jgi:uncharacterized membrane protein